MPTIVFKTNAEIPLLTEHRKHGAFNLGLYCANVQCRQFISFAVEQDEADTFINVQTDPPASKQLVQCPFCSQRQMRLLERMNFQKITEPTKRGSRERLQFDVDSGDAELLPKES